MIKSLTKGRYSGCNLLVSGIHYIILSTILKELEYFQNSSFFQQNL